MAITVAAAAGIASIVGIVIKLGEESLEQMSEEKKFETLRKAMDIAARTHPRVVKFNGWYCFGDNRDYESIEVKGGTVTLFPKKNAVNSRRVYFKPRDGYFSNDWLHAISLTRNGKDAINPPSPMSTDFCWKIFRDEFKNYDGNLAMQHRKIEDTIRIT